MRAGNGVLLILKLLKSHFRLTYHGIINMKFRFACKNTKYLFLDTRLLYIQKLFKRLRATFYISTFRTGLSLVVTNRLTGSLPVTTGGTVVTF